MRAHVHECMSQVGCQASVLQHAVAQWHSLAKCSSQLQIPVFHSFHVHRWAQKLRGHRVPVSNFLPWVSNLFENGLGKKIYIVNALWKRCFFTLASYSYSRSQLRFSVRLRVSSWRNSLSFPSAVQYICRPERVPPSPSWELVAS